MSSDLDRPHQEIGQGNYSSYGVGFVICFFLTIAAYFTAVSELIDGWKLDLALSVFGLAQAWTIMVVFFHLTRESKPRWNLVIFLFTILITVILVVGSIWIMNNLDYNLMVK